MYNTEQVKVSKTSWMFIFIKAICKTSSQRENSGHSCKFPCGRAIQSSRSGRWRQWRFQHSWWAQTNLYPDPVAFCSCNIGRISFDKYQTPSLPPTYSSPPSFPPKFQKRYQQTPPIVASRSFTMYVAALAFPGQQPELFFVAIIIIFFPGSLITFCSVSN